MNHGYACLCAVCAGMRMSNADDVPLLDEESVSSRDWRAPSCEPDIAAANEAIEDAYRSAMEAIAGVYPTPEEDRVNKAVLSHLRGQEQHPVYTQYSTHYGPAVIGLN